MEGHEDSKSPRGLWRWTHRWTASFGCPYQHVSPAKVKPQRRRYCFPQHTRGANTAWHAWKAPALPLAFLTYKGGGRGHAGEGGWHFWRKSAIRQKLLEHGVSPFLWILLRKTCEERKGGFGSLRGFWANLAAWHPTRVGVEARDRGVLGSRLPTKEPLAARPSGVWPRQ